MTEHELDSLVFLLVNHPIWPGVFYKRLDILGITQSERKPLPFVVGFQQEMDLRLIEKGIGESPWYDLLAVSFCPGLYIFRFGLLFYDGFIEAAVNSTGTNR